MRILQIGADRSKRGILFADTPAFKRQEAYAKAFGALDIIGFSRKADDAKEIQSGPLRVVPTNSSSRFSYIFDTLRIAKTLQKPDVVSAQDPFEAGLAAYFIARRFGVPLHIQVHTDYLSPEYAKLSFTNRIRVWIARFVLRRAKRIRVVSGRIANSLTMLDLGVPITVLPIFVDVEKFKNAESLSELGWTDERIGRSKYKLLMVSRAGTEKNIKLAINAFKKVAPENACLVLIGDIPSEFINTKRRIFGAGRIDPERYFKSADLILVPSKYEGYGLVIAEALAAGKPVLSTDVGAARELGAIITSEANFAADLKQWFENGPRIGELKSYPYQNFEEYVRAYCDDIEASRMLQ